MSSSYDLSTLINVLKTDSKELVNTKLEWIKLETYEKSSAIGSSLIFSLILVNLAFFALLFAFVALGFWFSDLVHNFAGGFGLVTVVYLLFAGIMLLSRKSIMRSFQNFLLKGLDPELKGGVDCQLKSTHLQVKSEMLKDKLEKNLEYLQENTGSLLFNSAVDAAVDKIPPIVTKLILRQLKKHFFKDK